MAYLIGSSIAGLGVRCGGRDPTVYEEHGGKMCRVSIMGNFYLHCDDMWLATKIALGSLLYVVFCVCCSRRCC